jgi:transposase
MQVLYPRCCGLDIHKKTVVACILLSDLDGTIQRFVRTFGTMTADLLAKGRLRKKLPALRLALDGRVQAHHRQLIGELLDHLDYLERAIHRVEESIANLLTEQEKAVQLLLTLPATGPVTAAAIIAEIGTDMGGFPSASHLASCLLNASIVKPSSGELSVPKFVMDALSPISIPSPT